MERKKEKEMRYRDGVREKDRFRVREKEMKKIKERKRVPNHSF